MLDKIQWFNYENRFDRVWLTFAWMFQRKCFIISVNIQRKCLYFCQQANKHQANQSIYTNFEAIFDTNCNPSKVDIFNFERFWTSINVFFHLIWPCTFTNSTLGYLINVHVLLLIWTKIFLNFECLLLFLMMMMNIYLWLLRFVLLVKRNKNTQYVKRSFN